MINKLVLVVIGICIVLAVYIYFINPSYIQIITNKTCINTIVVTEKFEKNNKFFIVDDDRNVYKLYGPERLMDDRYTYELQLYRNINVSDIYCMQTGSQYNVISDIEYINNL